MSGTTGKWTLENRIELIKQTVEKHRLNKERLEKRFVNKVVETLLEEPQPKSMTLKEVLNG